MSSSATKRKGKMKSTLGAAVDHSDAKTNADDEKMSVLDAVNAAFAIPTLPTNPFASESFGSLSALRPMTKINFNSTSTTSTSASSRTKNKLRVQPKSQNREVASRSRSRSRSRSCEREQHITEGIEVDRLDGDEDDDQEEDDEEYEQAETNGEKDDSSDQVVYPQGLSNYNGREKPLVKLIAPKGFDPLTTQPTIGMYYPGPFFGLVYPPPAPLVPPFPCRIHSDCTESNRCCQSHKYVLFVHLAASDTPATEWVEKRYGVHFSIPFPSIALCWLWLKEQITRLMGIPVTEQRLIIHAGRRIGEDRHFQRGSCMMFQSTIYVVVGAQPATIDDESTL